MISVLFPDAACFTYDLCGKFQSPSPEWMHLTRNLVNFELMVVTEGTLFIADERRSYEVHPGEYLLFIAPSDPTAGSVLDEFHAAPPSSYRLEDLVPAQLPSNYPETLCIPRQGTLSSPNRVIILMKQLQDTSLRFHNTFLNRVPSTAPTLPKRSGRRSCRTLSATSSTTAASPSKSPNSPVISATTTNTSPPSSTRAPE